MLALSYYILSLFAIIFVYAQFYRAEQKAKIKHKISTIILLASLLWLGYCFGLISSGILLNYSLPPRFPLLIILPFSALCILMYRSLLNSNITPQLNTSAFIYFQSFRILVEVMLYYTFIKGVLPESATFSGHNFDIIMGISAPIVGYLYTKGKLSSSLLRIWNIVGITMILVVAVIIGSSMYFPALWKFQSIVSDDFLSFPYFLIAACIAPWAILVHVILLAQQKFIKRSIHLSY